MAFKVHFLNQGRVDSILLECDGEYAFVDGGYRKNGINVIKNYLRAMNVKKLRYYIASHGHKNHVAAAAPIIDAFRPDCIIVGRVAVLDAIKRYATGEEKLIINQTPVKVMRPYDTIALGNAAIVCLGPMKQKSCSTGAYAENYNSLILRVDYHNTPTLLLTGDTSASIIAKCGAGAQARILKSPHHAGTQPASLLKQVMPEAVVICSNVKAGKTYRKRITNNDAAVFNVCEGRVVLSISEEEVSS